MKISVPGLKMWLSDPIYFFYLTVRSPIWP